MASTTSWDEEELGRHIGVELCQWLTISQHTSDETRRCCSASFSVLMRDPAALTYSRCGA